MADKFEQNVFQDDDLNFLLADPQIMSAVNAYAQDKITFYQAIEYAAKGRLYSAPEHFRFNFVQYFKLFHELARRIRAGVLVIPTEKLADPDLLAREAPPTPSRTIRRVEKLTLSQVEQLPDEENELIPRRATFTEEDISVLSKDLRFLACADALRQNIVPWIEFWIRFTDRRSIYPPRRLSVDAFTEAAREIGRRIESGQIMLPEDIRETYEFAYRPWSGEIDPAYT